jgi:excisionase family DNA binding protein
MDIISKRLDIIEHVISEHYLLQKEMLTFDEAAQYLDLSRSYLYRLTSSRQIPHYCPNGKRIYFKRSELTEWLQKTRVASKEEIEAKAISFTSKKKSL